MDDLCPKCLDAANVGSEGATKEGRTYKIYQCPTCGSITRVFDVPITERDVILVALVAEALSAKEIPSREKKVEDQLRLWFEQPRIWY